MLVVSRYPEQAIRIGDDVTVKVIRVGDHRVLVGVDAPRSIPVRREEVLSLEVREAALFMSRAQKLRILVVAGVAGRGQLIEETLARCSDLDTVTVANGKDAIQLIQLCDGPTGLCPDLVLLDLHPSGGSGLDVLDYVRSTPHCRTTPVVMMGDSDSDVDARCCLERGANAFVVKHAQQHAFRQSIHCIVDFWRHCYRTRTGSRHPVQE